MKITITFELDNLKRRAIAHNQGEWGAANYNTCKVYIRTVVDAALEDVFSDYVNTYPEGENGPDEFDE